MYYRCWNRWLSVFLIILMIVFPGVIFSKTAKAPHRTKSTSAKTSEPKKTEGIQSKGTGQGGLEYEAQSVVLMDAFSGQILYEKNPQLQMAPASFVKVLTLYLAFDALRTGQIKMDDMVTVSEKAWRIQGSKMFIKVGDRVKVEELLKGIAIASGNDACIALAEHMAGSEEAFTVKINEKAAQLGMKDSKFMNSHGMPADGQLTTAMDMAILAKRYVEDHPEALALHSTTEYEYGGIRQGNRNTLLQKNIGVDGLKTGHVEESGYHLLATAKRDNQRMIAVVMGCKTIKQRAREAQALLEYGFKNFSTVEAVKKGSAFGPVKVRRGKLNEVALVAAEDVRVTVAKGKEKSVTATPQLPASVTAPIQKGQPLAKVAVQNDGKLVKEVNLVSSIDVEKSLLPPWPVLAGIVAGLAILGMVGFWWFRRPKQNKF